MVEVAAVKAALKKRKEYINDNLDSLTTKKTRRLLEEDMELEKGGLDDHKDLITETLDKMLGDLADDGPSSSKGEDDTEGANGAKPAKKKGKEAPEKPAKAAAGKDEEDPRVAKLKRICQQAGIPVGPHLYKQSDRVAAFTAVLEQHGLHAKSTPEEIKKAKAQRDTHKELEGIDTSNIISGGRRRGARAAAPEPAAPAAKKQKTDGGSAEGSGDEDDDDDEEESDDDDFGGGGSSSEGGEGASGDDGGASGADDSDDE